MERKQEEMSQNLPQPQNEEAKYVDPPRQAIEENPIISQGQGPIKRKHKKENLPTIKEEAEFSGDTSKMEYRMHERIPERPINPIATILNKLSCIDLDEIYAEFNEPITSGSSLNVITSAPVRSSRVEAFEVNQLSNPMNTHHIQVAAIEESVLSEMDDETHLSLFPQFLGYDQSNNPKTD